MSQATATMLQFFGLLIALAIVGGVSLYRSPRLRSAAARLLSQGARPTGEGGNTPAKSDQPPAAPIDGMRWLLVGPSGSGKSTAARALVRSYLRRRADVTILDPDGSAWPRGARMVGAPDDYAAIGEALDQVQAIASERRGQFQRGTRHFDPILILIDEGPSVLRHTPGALDTVADLARRGRKLAISIILLTQDTQAKTLGIEGQTKLLANFDRLDCKIIELGVELSGPGIVQAVPFDNDARDLVLPLVEEAPPSARRRVEYVESVEADRLLRGALGIEHSNAATPVAMVAMPIATPETSPAALVASNVASGPEAPELLPPDVASNIAAIDWRSIALAVEGGISETAILKALGFAPGSTSVRYQAARQRLQAARAALQGEAVK